MALEKLGRNTAVLTVSALVMRLTGMLWQVWLAGQIGAAGIGLFQLVMSVGFLFVTVAVSGIRFTVTRLLSEELGLGREGSVDAVVGRAGVYALVFGFLAMAGLYFGAEQIARSWIGDGRTVLSLRLLALGLPAGGVSSLLGGYFTAVGRVWKTAAEQFAEQLVRMVLSAAALRWAAGRELGLVCAAVVGAGTAADIAGGLAMLTLYAFDRRRYARSPVRGGALTARMLKLAFPLALSAYARSALGTFRQMLVPRGLRLSGLDGEAALAGYGVINGMAMPVLTFLTCLPAAVAELLVPELTALQVRGETARLRATAERLLRLTLGFSMAAGAFFYVTAGALGALIYRSAESAKYIRLFAPMVPLIYTDIVTDGCLKGLGQMMRSMAYNVAEAALGLVLVWLLLPGWGLAGYAFVLYVCEVFNFALSLHRLRVVTGCRVLPLGRDK